MAANTVAHSTKKCRMETRLVKIRSKLCALVFHIIFSGNINFVYHKLEIFRIYSDTECKKNEKCALFIVLLYL